MLRCWQEKAFQILSVGLWTMIGFLVLGIGILCTRILPRGEAVHYLLFQGQGTAPCPEKATFGRLCSQKPGLGHSFLDLQASQALAL